MVHLGEDGGRLAENVHGKEVGGDEELELGGVVGGAERRSNEPHRLHRMSQAHAGLGVQLTVCHAEEEVRAVPLLALLGGEGLQDGFHRLEPKPVKDGSVTRHLPVVVGQTQRIAVRIYLPLALEHVGVLGRTRFIVVTVVSGRALVERICVRVYVDERELLADNACKHLAQVLVFLAKLYIGPHLGAGIPQPHGMDVSGINEGEAGVLVIVYGGVQRVGKTVPEHPAQLGIAQLGRHPGNFSLDGLGNKQAVLRGGTLVRILLRAAGQRAEHKRDEE